MKIGIDCRLAGRRHAGIGRYIENLICRLPGLKPDWNWVFFFSDEEQAADIKQQHTDTFALPNVSYFTIPVRHYTLSEQLKLPFFFQRHRLDLLHIPHFNIPLLYPGKIVVTIHDLLWHEFKGTHVTTLPSWQYWLKHRAYLFLVAQAMSRAKKIFVPAETIRRTIKKYYPKAEPKIVVTKEGVEDFIHSADKITDAQRLQRRAHSPRSQKKLIYVGSLYPHKNIRLVIDALHELPNYSLELIGTRNVFQDQVRAYVAQRGLSNRVHFLGYVPDAELQQLYNEATALVQPSFSEGFGLTGVEAMASGLPVLASDIPLFREIYQDGALYFSPKSVKSFVKAVDQLDQLNRASYVKKARATSRQYSWQKMSEETLAAYKELLHTSS